MLRNFIQKYKTLFVLFCVAFSASILIVFPLSKIPEWFEFGSEIGKLVYDISIGYIVSYIFFYLVVFLKEENDKKQINNRVSLQASHIILNGYSLFGSSFHNLHVIKKKFPPTLQKVKEACLQIDPFKSPVTLVDPMGSRPTTWQWVLRNHREENLKHIEKIKSLPYIDSKLLGILTNIEDCKLYYEATNRIFPTHKVEHFKDGSFMDQALYDYFQLINELEIYVEQNFKEFPNHVKLRNERKKLDTGE